MRNEHNHAVGAGRKEETSCAHEVEVAGGEGFSLPNQAQPWLAHRQNVWVDCYRMVLSGSLEIHFDVLATRLLGRRFRHIRHHEHRLFGFRRLAERGAGRVGVAAGLLARLGGGRAGEGGESGADCGFGAGVRTSGGFAGGGGSTRTTSSMQPMQDILLLCLEISF